MPDEIGSLTPKEDAELTAARHAAFLESPSTEAKDEELARECEEARRSRLADEKAKDTK
jgi:hypothetical protein